MKATLRNYKKTRIGYKEEFELCYMRHQYLRQSKHSPSREEMEPYLKIVENFSNNTYYVYKNLFYMCGLDIEDVYNNAHVQLVSFLGLFALERNDIKMKNFKVTFKGRNSIRCTKEDILNKNKANFTCFLKQRMQDMVRVCYQKAKNIKGLQSEEFTIFVGNKLPPNDIEELLENHEKYGYKPITSSVFKTIKKRMKWNQKGPVYLFNSKWYVCVPTRKKFLTLTDFACQDFDPYTNEHNTNPEQILENKEAESKLEMDKEKFEKFSNKEKVRIVKLFISKNKNNVELKEELATACEFLEKLHDSTI